MQLEMMLTGKDAWQTEQASFPTQVGIFVVCLDDGRETHPLSESQSVLNVRCGPLRADYQKISWEV